MLKVEGAISEVQRDEFAAFWKFDIIQFLYLIIY
jgi:hypothetical protein